MLVGQKSRQPMRRIVGAGSSSRESLGWASLGGSEKNRTFVSCACGALAGRGASERGSCVFGGVVATGDVRRDGAAFYQLGGGAGGATHTRRQPHAPARTAGLATRRTCGSLHQQLAHITTVSPHNGRPHTFATFPRRHATSQRSKTIRNRLQSSF